MPAHDLFELVLCVKDVDVAAAFYREVVGLEPISRPGNGWASFWAGEKNENRWLGLRQGSLLYEQHSPLPEGHRFGPVHYAFKLPASEFDATLERLRAHDITVYGPENWEPGRFEGSSYYFYDPDANLLEVWFPKA
ncbi:MAG: VOC family protein [Armatimonadetes bacterium]|nr:VOC family protein [Armatimonadota bacterium]